MCKWTLDIHLCGHHDIALADLCDKLVEVNTARIANARPAGINNDFSSECMIPCRPPATINDVKLSNVVLEPFRCAGPKRNECDQPQNTPGWPAVAHIAVNAILQEVNTLKAEVGNTISILADKRGEFIQDPQTDAEREGFARAMLYADKSLTSALLNHEEIAEPFYDVLSRYRRLTNAYRDGLVNKLQDAYALYSVHVRADSEQINVVGNVNDIAFQQQHQEIDNALLNLRVDQLATTHSINALMRTSYTVDNRDLHGDTMHHLIHTIANPAALDRSNWPITSFEDTIAATMVNLEKAKASMATLKSRIARFEGLDPIAELSATVSRSQRHGSNIPTEPRAMRRQTVAAGTFVGPAVREVTTESSGAFPSQRSIPSSTLPHTLHSPFRQHFQSPVSPHHDSPSFQTGWREHHWQDIHRRISLWNGRSSAHNRRASYAVDARSPDRRAEDERDVIVSVSKSCS